MTGLQRVCSIFGPASNEDLNSPPPPPRSLAKVEAFDLQHVSAVVDHQNFPGRALLPSSARLIVIRGWGGARWTT